MDRQLPIPGLEKDVANPIRYRKTGQIKALQDRVLALEFEVSLLKIQLTKKQSAGSTPLFKDWGSDCYFLSNDRCLGRPADTCRWSVKVGDWEWLCAYPWKGEPDHA